jgi:hypothetical protein
VNAQLEVVLIAAGCTSGVGLMGLGVIRLLRRASLRLSLQVSGAIVVLAVVGGTLGTAEAMFLSAHDLRVVIMVCMVAAVVAVGFGCLIGQQLQAGSLALRQATRSLGDLDGGYRSPAGPMMAELAALSRELGEISEKLEESRAREHALDQSRRQLVAWVPARAPPRARRCRDSPGRARPARRTCRSPRSRRPSPLRAGQEARKSARL